MFICDYSEYIRIVSSSRPNNIKIHPIIRKKKSQIQTDIVNFQKFHQIARMVNPDDQVTKYAIPWIIKWLKTVEWTERMR